MNYHKAQFEAAFGFYEQLPPSSCPEIAFAGRSNVGKSSLLNKLFNRKSLARVSSMPGKTATINFYRVDDVRFVDLPGYGYAKVAKSEKKRWAELIDGYFDGDRALALVVQLLDIRHAPSADDQHMIRYMIEREIPFVLALTKADKLSRAQQRKRLEGFMQEIEYADQMTFLPVSSETGAGIEALKEVLEEVLSAETEPDGLDGEPDSIE